MYEQETLHKALAQLERTSGFQTSLEPLLKNDDSKALLRLNKKDKHYQFTLVIKLNLTPPVIFFYNKQRDASTNDAPLLFITHYVNNA